MTADMEYICHIVCSPSEPFSLFPVPASPSLSRKKLKLSAGAVHRFTLSVGTVFHLWPIKHHETRMLSRVLWRRFLFTFDFLHTSQSILLLFLFQFLRAKLRFVKKRQENTVTWCILVVDNRLLNISWAIWWGCSLRIFRSHCGRIWECSPSLVVVFFKKIKYHLVLFVCFCFRVLFCFLCKSL